MKKVLLVFGMALLVFSCSSNSPEAAAKGFAESIAKGKIDDAKKYATPETAQLLSMLSGFADQMPVKPDFKFEKVKDSINPEGTKAWVTFKDEGGKEETLELSKVDGKWLVDMQPKK